jgi:hypothetical protein
MKNYIFVLLAALLFFTACDREDAGVQPLALEFKLLNLELDKGEALL